MSFRLYAKRVRKLKRNRCKQEKEEKPVDWNSKKTPQTTKIEKEHMQGKKEMEIYHIRASLGLSCVALLK